MSDYQAWRDESEPEKFKNQNVSPRSTGAPGLVEAPERVGDPEDNAMYPTSAEEDPRVGRRQSLSEGAKD